jgi:hypothetical protein
LCFCCSVMGGIHFSVDICEQRHAPTIWMTCSEVPLKLIASFEDKRSSSYLGIFVISSHELQLRCICRSWVFMAMYKCKQ